MPRPLIQLNPEQTRAVHTTEGPLLILAGAGSGKTRVLVHRIAHILEQGLAEPWQIMAVTFTNKAAQEMRDRLLDHVGPSVRRAWIGTFHALSGRILRMEGHRIGLKPGFTIYDADDAKRTLKEVMKKMGLDNSARELRAVLHSIERAKNAGLMPEEFAAQASPRDNPGLRVARQIYPRYEQALRDSNAADFGDLLLLTKELFAREPAVRARLSGRFRYLMVDEFQDTNQVQYSLLKALSSTHQNLAVVGDDDQSIYRWRGADVENILGFAKDFAGTTVVTLEENYRSSENILRAANAVIRNNTRRHPKALRTSQGPGLPVGLALVTSSSEEAELVARDLAQRISEGARPEEFSVLYRANAQSRAFEEALRKAQVPHALVGATGFYERQEVKDILSYLRLIANPASLQDLLRVINVPARRLGKTTIARLMQAAEAEGAVGLAALSLPPGVLLAAGLNKPAIKRLRELAALFQALTAQSQTAPASEVAKAVIEQTAYEAHLKRDPSTAEDRIENIQELVSSIVLREEERALQADLPPEEGLGLAGARTPLQAFLDEASLLSAQEQLDEREAVRLMTIHTAKGMEFPVVYLVGMEEGTFPVQRIVEDEDPQGMEEERRLCYVAITRAMRELNLVAARMRLIYGFEEVRQPSRFITELPEAVIGGFGGQRAAPPPRLAPAGAQPVYRDDSPQDDPFAVGLRVTHKLFGDGEILAREGAGASARLKIRFGTADKNVLARYVSPAST